MYALTDSNLWVGLVSGMRPIPILILPIFAGAVAHFTTNEIALLTSAIASITSIASPAFRRA